MHEYITIPGGSQPATNVEGAILAGGDSRRMGRDKALLPIGGRTFLEAVADALAPVVGRIRLIGRGPAPALPPVGTQPDLYPGRGPLSGIHAALATAEAGRVLVVACDLPFVTTAFLRGLVDALSPQWDAVVPCPGGNPVAVCAVYRIVCLENVEERITRGELAAGQFARSLNARFLDDSDLERLDPSGRCLMNLNTPLDYEKAAGMLGNESKT